MSSKIQTSAQGTLPTSEAMTATRGFPKTPLELTEHFYLTCTRWSSIGLTCTRALSFAFT